MIDVADVSPHSYFGERYTTSVEVELGNRAASKLTGALAQDRQWF